MMVTITITLAFYSFAIQTFFLLPGWSGVHDVVSVFALITWISKHVRRARCQKIIHQTMLKEKLVGS